MSMYFTQKKDPLPIADNSKADEQLEKAKNSGYKTAHPHVKKGPVETKGAANDEGFAETVPFAAPATNFKPKGGDIQGDAHENRIANANSPTVEQAKHGLAQDPGAGARLSHPDKEGSLETTGNNGRIAKLGTQKGSQAEYEAVLKASLATLRQKRNSPLPASARKLSKEKLAELNLAFSILEAESTVALKANAGGGGAAADSAQRILQKKVAGEQANPKIAALHTFIKVFNGHPIPEAKISPKIAEFHPKGRPGHADKAPDKGEDKEVDLSTTIQRWKKELNR